MDRLFQEDENLYRAVRPATMYWRKDGSLSSAAFKERKGKGLSVERGDYRNDSDVIKDMRRMGFEGTIVRLSVAHCHGVGAVLRYLPTDTSNYHSEIHGSNERINLTDSQCKRLADNAIVIG